jgi:hypothetical protein
MPLNYTTIFSGNLSLGLSSIFLYHYYKPRSGGPLCLHYSGQHCSGRSSWLTTTSTQISGGPDDVRPRRWLGHHQNPSRAVCSALMSCYVCGSTAVDLPLLSPTDRVPLSPMRNPSHATCLALSSGCSGCNPRARVAG